MKRPYLPKIFFAVSLLSLLGQSARAQVLDFGAQKSEFGDQTSDNTAPSSVVANSLFAYVDVDNHQDQSNFTVSDNGSVTLNYTGDNYNGSMYIGSDYEGNNYYFPSSSPTLDQDFTPGDNYTFSATGGSIDGQSASVAIPSDNSYTPFLYLAGTSFSQAQAIDPTTNFILNLASSTFGGSGAVTSASFGLFDSVGQLYQLNFTPGASTITIPQSELAKLNPGEVYTGSITTFNTTDGTIVPVNPADGTNAFANANYASVGFATTTNFTFVVAPEPASWVMSALGMATLLALGSFLRLRDRISL